MGADQLTTFWLEADSELRQAITTSAPLLERHLQTDPLHIGESRNPGERIHFVPPLAITYEVDALNRIVTILAVRVFRRRR
jgi:hypothetical protein